MYAPIPWRAWHVMWGVFQCALCRVDQLFVAARAMSHQLIAAVFFFSAPGVEDRAVAVAILVISIRKGPHTLAIHWLSMQPCERAMVW